MCRPFCPTAITTTRTWHPSRRQSVRRSGGWPTMPASACASATSMRLSRSWAAWCSSTSRVTSRRPSSWSSTRPWPSSSAWSSRSEVSARQRAPCRSYVSWGWREREGLACLEQEQREHRSTAQEGYAHCRPRVNLQAPPLSPAIKLQDPLTTKTAVWSFPVQAVIGA